MRLSSDSSRLSPSSSSFLSAAILPAFASALLLACSACSSAPSDTSEGSSATASLSVGECEPVTADDDGAANDLAMSSSAATAACGARGLVVGGSADAYKCCKEPPVPIDAGAGTGGSCSLQSLGRHDSCADRSTWSDDAVKTCELAGGTIASVSYSDSCGDELFRYAKFTCCTTDDDGGIAIDAGPGPIGTSDASPPPPPESDGGLFIGDDGGVTTSPEDAGPEPCQYYAIADINGVCNDSKTDLASAKAQCSSLGLALEQYSTMRGTCGDGQDQQANYACCGPTAITITSGGPSSP